MPYIHYPVQFQKERKEVTKALINSSSEVNAITLAFTKKLSLQIWQINVKARKIDDSFLKTFGMVIVSF